MQGVAGLHVRGRTVEGQNQVVVKTYEGTRAEATAAYEADAAKMADQWCAASVDMSLCQRTKLPRRPRLAYGIGRSAVTRGF